MILLFDAGNTRLKWAIAKADGQILEAKSMRYDGVSDALSGVAKNFEVTEISISSVAGSSRNLKLTDLCESEFGLKPSFAEVSSRACGVTNRYLSLDSLGVDRWVAALGATMGASLGDPAAGTRRVNRVIVDAGTAVTVDLVNAENEFLGGAILPGAKMMHDSLVGETAGIKSEPLNVSSAIGKDTQQCVNVGAKYGLAGAVDRVIGEFVCALGETEEWQVVVCGGDAQWLMGLLKTPLPICYQPNLIFQGLLNLKQFSDSR